MKKAEYFISSNRFVFWQNETSERKKSKRFLSDYYSHYGLCHKILNKFNGATGFLKDIKPEKHASVKHYFSLWKTRRFGHGKRFFYEAEMTRNGFIIEFFYSESREPKRTNGGRYDSNKEKYFTYYEKLELKRNFNILSSLIEKEGAVYAESRINRKGWDKIDFKINKDPDRHWGYGESYHEQDYHKNHNAKDRDKKLIKNGELKYFRNRWDGFIRCGLAYHNTNNKWWVLLPSGKITNMACFELFDAKPEDIKKRREARDTSTSKEKARKKLGSKLYYECIKKGVEVNA